MASASHPQSPGRLRASTTVHLASVSHLAPSGAASESGAAARLEQVRLLDDALDVLETEPAFRQLTLTGGAAALESYLSLRPEHYERIERAVRHRRLVVGPWYVDPARPFPEFEIALRNLHLGLWTCCIFGRATSTVYLPGVTPGDLPAYMPQALRGFGIDALVLDAIEGVPLEGYLVGDDGTRLPFGSALRLPQSGDLGVLRPRYSESVSQSALVVRPWALDGPRAARVEFVQRLGRIAGLAQDEITHSSPESYAWGLRWLASQRVPPPEIPLAGPIVTPEPVARAARLLLEVAEPLAARAEDMPPAPDEPTIRRPQAILRRAWQALLQALAPGSDRAESAHLVGEAEALTRALIELLGGAPDSAAPYASAVTSDGGFRILAAKPPEDSAWHGLIVRGVNVTDTPIHVMLRPWRRFSTASVLGLDEAPTGGALGVDSEGAIRFRAAPQRIVSFLFTDEPPSTVS